MAHHLTIDGKQAARAASLRNLAVVTSIAIVSSLIGLVLLEGMVRWFYPLYDPSGQVQFVVDPNGLALGPKNRTKRQSSPTGDFDVSVQFNASGFRDSKDVASVRSGDIVVVGDSFAYGWGVEESQRFSNLLQDSLRKRVFNIATPGDFENYDRLLKYADALGGRIEEVVIAVCMENDLSSYGVSRLAYSSSNFRAIKGWLSRSSALYRIFTASVLQNPWLKNLVIRANLLRPQVAFGLNAYSRETVERSADRLAEIAGRYKHTVILIVPSRALWVGNNRTPEDRMHREFVAALAARHLNVVDMRETFESGGDPLSNHFRNDGHWNPTGQRLAAKSLVAKFSE